jgi:chromosome segregation ATPase
VKEGKCIMGEMRKDREGELPNDVDGLIDHYRHEVRKGQEAYDGLLKELNMLRGTKHIVERLSGDFSKMKKRAQEAEGELSILRGIETNRVKEAQATSGSLQDELDRIKKENNDLFNRVADSLEVSESHQKLNGKLQERLTELEEENKKMHDHIKKQVDGARKAGM